MSSNWEFLLQEEHRIPQQTHTQLAQTTTNPQMTS
jgi:hypothetical protein